MKLALALLMCLPLAGQVGIDDLKTSGTLPGEWTAVKIYEVPTDWATVKRPTLAATVTALKAERTAGDCQECLHISEPGIYRDGKGVTWYVINHPRPGTVAVQDKALFAEIARCPKFTDGEHDELWISNYLDAQIKLGTMRMWRERAAVYDKDGKVLVPAVPLIPLDWKPPVDEVK